MKLIVGFWYESNLKFMLKSDNKTTTQVQNWILTFKALYLSTMAKKPKNTEHIIAQNKPARHDYLIQEKYEAVLVLTGWEVKSLRAGTGQLSASYVFLRVGEAWLLGAHIEPLKTASTHVVAEPTRYRKLLLNSKELAKIFAATQQKGYTCLALKLYWKQHLIKCEIALGKGKKDHDKRLTEKDRDWDRQKQRIAREHNR